MAENSKIEWTDHTFNPWIGCTKVGPGCDHCYAEKQDNHRQWTPDGWGAGKPRKRTSEANWRKPLQWNKQAEQEGKRYRVFCASLADWLDNEVPIEWLIDLLDLIHKTPNLDWLLLTKRIGNFIPRLIRAADHGCIQGNDVLWIDGWREGRYSPDNIWLGSTMVNQDEYDRDAKKLTSIPAKVHFISYEPALGAIDLQWCEWCGSFGKHDCYEAGTVENVGCIDWVIAGGESGPNARPAHPDWFRSLRDQCEAAGVPYLFKQWGEYAPNWFNDNDGNKIPESEWIDRIGKKSAGRLLDGREHNGFPT